MPELLHILVCSCTLVGKPGVSRIQFSSVMAVSWLNWNVIVSTDAGRGEKADV
jgi:hypothetical protein